MTKNWKTTSAGLLAIAGAFVRLYFAWKANDFTEESLMTSITAIVTGVGLLVSKDHNVTGGTVEQ